MLLTLFLTLPAVAQTAPYDALTDTSREVVNFNPEPHSAMVRTPAGDVWAINPYANTLLRFDASTFTGLGTGAPPRLAPSLLTMTGLSPVAVAYWDNGEGSQVLVTCMGSHGLFLHDPVDGTIDGFVLLQTTAPEVGVPGHVGGGADIVVDGDRDRAYVSVPEVNGVIEIDLVTQQVVGTTFFDVGRRPGPLMFDAGSPESATDDAVYVAMTITGNDTTAVAIGGSVDVVLDASPTAFSFDDFDVYRIDVATGAAAVVGRGAGSLLFDLERNPESGALWVLGMESFNAAEDTEPEQRGRFGRNVLQLMDDTATLPVFPSATTDLDLRYWINPQGYSADSSINQARSVEFVQGGSFNGYAFVASPFVDRIIVLGPDGVRAPEDQWTALPADSNCFDLAFAGTERELLLAYCLGTMTIEVLHTSSKNNVADLDLGLDPTPTQIARGRRLFLDGDRSEHSRTSCASCHPGGMSDQLGWAISDAPEDTKDVMLTQTLMSIAETYPHHWRGERELKDFKKAFVGLLGATPAPSTSVHVEPSDQEMEDLIAFILSLQAQANPVQSPARLLDDSRRSRIPDNLPDLNDPQNSISDLVRAARPVQGQEWFATVPNFAEKTCLECHAAHTGSDGNFTVENPTGIPRASVLEVAHLRQLNVRGLHERPLNQTLGIPVNVNGFGVTHDGVGEGLGVPGASLIRFIFDVGAFKKVDGEPGGLTDRQRLDVFRFVDQFDQGISPSAHWGVRITSPAQNMDIALNGAANGWNDVVAISENAAGQTVRYVRSQFSDGKFVSQSGTLVDPLVLQSRAQAGLFALTVLGVPLGSGWAFGIDHDRDGLLNGLDSTPWLHAPAANATQPALQSVVLEFETARVAKYRVRFTEPVTYEVSYSHPSLAAPLVYESVRGPVAASSLDFVLEDTFVLPHNVPSGAGASMLETFTVEITLTDRAGNVQTYPLIPDGETSNTFQPERAEDQAPAALNHIESVVPMTPSTSLAGFESFKVQVTARENERIPGGDFVGAQGVLVFGTVAIENLPPLAPEEAAFTRVATFGNPDFSSAHQTSFSTPDLVTGLTPYVPYTKVQNYIVSELTSSAGVTTFEFHLALSTLPAGADVKFTVQGIMRPETASSVPFECPLIGLDEMTFMNLEGGAEHRFVR